MEKTGEFHPEKETKEAKKIQKVVYTPIEKTAGETFVKLPNNKPKRNER